MNDLIERLEKATGPDRELDYAITFEVDRDRFEYCDRTRIDLQRSAFANGLTNRDEACRRAAFYVCKAYTASLDAALSLVPEGLAWTLGQNVHHRYWQASVNNLDEDGRPQSIGYSGLQGNLTAPIALCIAALRARDSAERDLTDMEAGK